MQISYNWLRELVDFGWDAQTLASKLTLNQNHHGVGATRVDRT